MFDMSEYAIEVENLCIQYKGLQSFSLKNGLFGGKRSKPPVVEAVKNVSFKLEKGEILGIVGKNGSGKSTLLRAIAGIFSPNSGTIDLHGHSVSLLSIGVGFQKELSGRENILLSGLLLGFTEEQIREKEDAIIAFSELGKFIDSPVRTYSSGMYSKLAFSITAILETDIILIDEVLSVGDPRFKKKSYAKMKQLISDKDRTVVIVSHDSRAVNNLCTKILWVNDGEFVKFGDTADVMPEYEQSMATPLPEVQPQELRSSITGEDLAYLWQLRLNPQKPWQKATFLGMRTDTLHVRPLPNRAEYEFRCMVTDKNGNVQYSDIITLEMPPETE